MTAAIASALLAARQGREHCNRANPRFFIVPP
jgi:hypothetical protein